MEGTLPNLLALLYELLLIVHSCLIMTPIHTNKYWSLALEIAALIFISSVSVVQNGVLLACFWCGAVFVVTLMHGLNLNRTIKTVLAVEVVIALVVICSETTSRISPELWVLPILHYAGVFILAGISELAVKFGKG